MLLRKFLENWIVWSGIYGKIDHNCLQLFNLEGWGIYENCLLQEILSKKEKRAKIFVKNRLW